MEAPYVKIGLVVQQPDGQTYVDIPLAAKFELQATPIREEPDITDPHAYVITSSSTKFEIEFESLQDPVTGNQFTTYTETNDKMSPREWAELDRLARKARFHGGVTEESKDYLLGVELYASRMAG